VNGRREGRGRGGGAAVRAGTVLIAAAAALLGPAGASWAATTPTLAQHNSATDSNGDPVCVSPSSAELTQIPWAQTYLDAESVWSLSEGSGVSVAVLGSGVDDASGVLAGRLTLGPQEESGGAGTGTDCVGQGTFVAGLIAAQPRTGTGFAGIAPAADILAIGVTDGAGTATAATLAAGIRDAAGAGARIIDVSVTVASTDPALNSAVSYAIGKGALIVAPYLADGQSSDTPTYPAALPGVLSVSDLEPGGALSGSAPAPSPGTTAAAVDLAAPGDGVLGIGPGGSGMFQASGPSYAAAYVAGTAALVLGYRPDLTEAQLLFRLEQTADHPGTELPDPQLGYGTVDPVNAVTEELPQESASHGPAAAPAAAPRTSLIMPVAASSNAPREALDVAVGALAVMLFVGLGAGIRLAARRRTGAAEVQPEPTLD
jgi:membrane-anchored mycosin MYCP